MKDTGKTKAQLVSELAEMRRVVRDLQSEGKSRPTGSSPATGAEFESGLLEYSPNPILVINPDTSINYVNPALEKLTGYASSELIGRKPPYPWWTDGGQQTPVGELDKAMRDRNRKLQTAFRNKDGEPFWVEITSTPVRVGGKLQYYLASWVDITERRQTEEKEREYTRGLMLLSRMAIDLVELSLEEDIYEFVAQRLKQLAGNAVVVVNSFDESSASFCLRQVLGIEEHWETLCSILGGSPLGLTAPIDSQARTGLTSGKLEQVPGGLYALASGGVSKSVCRKLEKLLNVDNIYAMGFSWRTELFGSVVLLMGKGTAWRNPDIIEAFVSQASVALQRRQAQEALRKANDELETRVSERTSELAGANQELQNEIAERRQAEEKLQTAYTKERELRSELETEIKKRIEFTRALVHELKTPLTPLLASSKLLIDELPEGILLDLARNMDRGAANLDRRIDELLDLARGELGMLQIKHRLIEPLEFLHQIFDEMLPVASGHGLSLALDLPASFPPVRADADRLRQVVLNLMSNACKFTPRGGNIILRARTDDSDLSVEVEDTGPGIGDDDQRRLFNAYHRLVDDREHLSGLGLGLALCRTLVELHGGRVWVKSQPGAGSTFGFSLPLQTTQDETK